MGWFDESDDNEEDEEPAKTAAAPAPISAHDNEEDPLDAYMKSLEQPSSATPTKPRAERLDISGTEEATSHWEEVRVPTKQPEDEEDTGNNSAAAAAMASTFHRAGSSKQERDEEELKLDPIHHDTMHYSEFQKEFWTPSDTTRGHAWRSEHHITCTLSVDPVWEFEELQHVFGRELNAMIVKKGLTEPTLVQSQTLPVALSGRDAIITAATGSGKTLSYVWPMVVHVSASLSSEGPIGLVLAPTRELAVQIHKNCKTMLPNNSSLAIIGGTSRYQLFLDIKRNKYKIVVATPGRLLDVLSVKKKGGMSLQHVTMVVLDEADKMLDMGFESQVSQILNNIRPDRQSLLLSATMGKKVERVAQQWLQKNPVRIAVGRTGESSQHVDQHVMVLPSVQAKKDWMMEMIPILASVGRTLVFVATRASVEELATQLRQVIAVETLHGDKHQSDRTKALKAFTKQSVPVLIATEVAARGLDVPNVKTVVNFDAAKNLDAHVHRIGRAGRLSSEQEHARGAAYTLLIPKNADFAHVLVNAFRREGREVSGELQTLANKSRRSGNVAVRNKWNKSGLGFAESSESSEVGAASSNGNYYGPVSGREPPAKKSRWG